MAIFDKMTKWPYLSPEVPNPNDKRTFYSSTFKVEEKKVPLFFFYLAPAQMSQIQKSKRTFYSSTFKVEEQKMELFFGLGAPGLKYLVLLQVKAIIKIAN